MCRIKSILIAVILMTASLAGFGQVIDSIEYFFDADPGYSAATRVHTGTPDTTVNLSETLNASSLDLGFHVLYMRALQSMGVVMTLDSTHTTYDGDGLDSAYFSYDTIKAWGPYESRIVYVDQSGGLTINIDALEYFFNDDPGYGNGTSISVTSGNVINLSTTLNSSGLPLGFHTLYVRARAENNGDWGLAESQLVYVDPSGSMTVNIDSIEYFFDADPGYGNGIGIDVTPDSVITFTDSLQTDTLSAGFHILYVRVKSTDGEWGQAESRLIYVQDGSVGQAVLIDQIEYFFDRDPGYGSGTIINVTPENAVNLTDSLVADTVATGFHTLFLRARGQGGKWGQAESRLVFIDQSGTILSPIDELEYFIDSDPGYGAGTSVPVSPPSFEVFREFAVSTASLSEGSHTFHIRAKNQDGQWGMAEPFPFVAYNYGRELDSATLRYMYNQLGGTGWTTQTNWLTGSIDNWYGVTVVNSRVDSLELPANNLVGDVPFQLGYLGEVKKIDLSQNNLTDTIPDQAGLLSNLQELYLYDNQLNRIPDLSGITSLNTLALDSNYFDFDDLEPNISVSNYTYSNQVLQQEVDTDTIVAIGQSYTIDIDIGGTNNIYQWFHNGDTIAGQDLQDYLIGSFAATDTGYYQLKIQNSVVTGLEMSSATYYTILNDFDQDSLALVSLYTSLDGTNWTNSAGWLADSLINWNGVTVGNRRVTGLSLPSNNLSGVIPDDFHYADSLLTIDLSGNEVMDTIPVSIANWDYLTSMDLSNNMISSIPAFNSILSLTNLDVSGNRLQFGELEVNVGIPTFAYSPQDSVYTYTDTIADRNDDVSLLVPVTGTNNTYQWYKDDVALGGAISNPLALSNVQFADEGYYRLEIQNNLATNLTLSSSVFQFKVSSLTRDSIALRTIYDEMGGLDWTVDVNWLDGPITGWNQITIENDRVLSVDLGQGNLTGALPKIIRDITSLQTADFADNEISTIPNMSQMPDLNTLDISGNRIGFAEIILNQPIPNFIYDPQNPIGSPILEKIPVGDPYTFDGNITGVGNLYQWNYEGNPIPGATSKQFQLESIEYDSMGVYTVDVTNPLVEGFMLTSNDIEVLATADISGTVLNGADPLTSGGDVSLWLVLDGPFDSVDVATIETTGAFLLQDIVLDDYIMKAVPTDDNIPVSYYGGSNTWTEADTIELRTQGEIYDIQLVGEFSTGVEDDVLGLVEADLESGDESGRIEARRKVKKAGCSLRRRTRSGGGRTGQDEFDLYLYTETNDEGNFVFKDIPDGTYVINIDYPGVPMDPNSFIEFEFGPSVGLETIELAALITSDGIVVEQTNALGFDAIEDFKVYPNPATEKITLSYQIGIRMDDLHLKAWTPDGKLIHQEALPHQMGIQQKELDVTAWDTGLYYLIIENSDKDVIVQWKLLIGD